MFAVSREREEPRRAELLLCVTQRVASLEKTSAIFSIDSPGVSIFSSSFVPAHPNRILSAAVPHFIAQLQWKWKYLKIRERVKNENSALQRNSEVNFVNRLSGARAGLYARKVRKSNFAQCARAPVNTGQRRGISPGHLCRMRTWDL